MSTEHQTLKTEGDALARTMAHHRMGQTNPTAHQLMQVGAWEQRCAAAGYDGNMGDLVERWIYAFNETMRKKMKEQLDKIWMGEIFGADVKALGGIRELVVPYEDDAMLGPEVEISSYPTHIQVLKAERPELSIQSYGRSMRDKVWPKTVEIQSMSRRIGYTDLITDWFESAQAAPSQGNRKERRAQAAEKRGCRP